jgi:hypothetical protein
MAAAAISDNLKDRTAATFAAPKPVLHVTNVCPAVVGGRRGEHAYPRISKPRLSPPPAV